MIETKYKITNKITGESVVATYVESDAPTADNPKYESIFKDEAGVEYKFDNPNQDFATITNPDFSIEQLPNE